MTRFIVYVCTAFIATFVGVTWAAHGFPMSFSGPVTVSQSQPTVTATFGDQSAKDYERKMWEAEHTARSDGDAELDRIRLDALQAGNAYAMSPCDDTMKSNLIAAVTAYTRAWQKKLNCQRPLNMRMFCDTEKLKQLAATFSTPLDVRVRVALSDAFNQRGVIRADFPEDIRVDVLQFAGPGLWFGESPLCLPRLRAAGSRR
jgi:hypothetical protein